jgi:hypothetical protein
VRGWHTCEMTILVVYYLKNIYRTWIDQNALLILTLTIRWNRICPVSACSSRATILSTTSALRRGEPTKFVSYLKFGPPQGIILRRQSGDAPPCNLGHGQPLLLWVYAQSHNIAQRSCLCQARTTLASSQPMQPSVSCRPSSSKPKERAGRGL